MKNVKKLLACLGVSVACLMGMTQLAHATVAGYVQFVSGDVQITSPAGQTHPAQKGDAVGEGDTVTSAPAASAQIKMQDGGFVAMRPDTKLKFDQFVFSGKQDGNEKSFFSLFKGGFRAVTGFIGQINKQNYRITTPSATIGIRGTDHETFLVVPGSPMAQIAPTGAYSKVNVGETSLTTDKGAINVLPNQMGFAGGMDQAPKLQPVNTNIFTVAPAPTLGAKTEKKEEKKEEKAEAKQEQKTAKSEEKKEGGKDSKQADKGNGEAKGDTKETKQASTEKAASTSSEQAPAVAAAQQETVAPIRSTAVVDAVAPSAGLVPSPVSPAPVAVVATVIEPPPAPTTVVPTTTVAGLTVNLATGTATTNTGQVLTIQQGLVAAQAQTAATAAVAAATAAQTAVTTATTDNTTLTGIALVNTAPAVTAISTATPVVSTATALTPVATAPASTAVGTATTSISTASTAVTAASALAAAATAPVSAAIGTATTNIGTASTAVTTATAITPVVTTPVSTAIGTATTNIGTASTAVTAASALTPVNAATATANATAAQTAATTAAAQALAAQTAFTANMQFADATLAVPANAMTQSTNTTLQSANTAVQSAATTVTAQNTALIAAQAAAVAALATANTSLTTANTNLTTATSQNTALTAAQAAAVAALTTANANLTTANANLTTATNQNTALTAAQAAAAAALATANTNLTTVTNQNTAITTAQGSTATQLAAAQAAATAAQTAATAAQAAATQAAALQAAGDLVGAQAQLTIAQQQSTIAQQQQAVAATAQAAVTAQLTIAQTAQASGLASVTGAVAATTTAQAQAAMAQTAVTTATAAVSTATTAATTAASSATTAQTQAAAAQTALTAANTAATTATTAANTAATSAATASTQATAAQTAVSTATTAVNTATTVAGAADTAAATASTQAAAATTASTNATAALTTSTTNLGTVTTNAPIVAANAPIAAYNNPAVVGNFKGVTMLSVPVTGGFNAAFPPNNPAQLNTSYVLDGSGNLVEMRNSQFQVQANQNGNVLVPSIIGTAGADIKWSGGTAADTFMLADNSIYMGRWVGATVTVTDNTTAAVYTYPTIADNVWLVALPAPTGYVPTLVGTTTYTMAGHTTPVDAFGNLGVLTSATLVANFTSQVVDAAVNLNMSTGTMAGTFSVTSTNRPIQGGNSSGFASGPMMATCTGTCTNNAATGYSADLGGGFAGTGAASAAMSYNIWPTTALSSDPASDSIQGLVAFTATPPTAGINPTAGSYGRGFIIPYAVTPPGYQVAMPTTISPAANTSIVLDGVGGNVVKLLNTPFMVTSGGMTPIPPIASADVSWSGGVAFDYYSAGGITFGRWQGGSVTVTDLSTVVAPFSISLAQTGGMVGPTSSAWAYATGPANGYVQSLVGATVYANTANTTPFDSQGGMGVLTSSGFTADFTAQLVSATLNLTMNTGPLATNVLNVTAANMPISSNGFGATYLATVVSCTAGPCNGANGFIADVQGSFTGATASSVLLGYGIAPSVPTSPSTDIISGYVAFNTTTAPTAGTNPAAGNYAAGFMIPVPMAGGYNTGRPIHTPPMINTSILLDGSGNMVRLLGTTYEEPGGPPGTINPPLVSIASANVAWSGGTATDYYQSVSGNVTFGRWQGGSVNVTDLSIVAPLAPFSVSLAGGTFGPTSSVWAYGVAPANSFIQSLTGTTIYTKTGNTTPFDSQGGMGVLNSASLTADFTNQLVNAALQLTMNTGPLAADVFNVSATMPINALVAADPSGFKVTATSPVPVVACSVGTCNPGAGGAFKAEIRGAFAGAAAVDAVLGYGIWNETPTAPSDVIYGYVAFNTATAPTVNPAGPLAPYAATNTAVAYNGAYGGGFNFIAAPGEVTPLGNPTTLTENYGGGWGFRTDALVGALTATPPTTTANGITFGVWDTVTSVSASEQHLIAPSNGGSSSHSYMYGMEGYLDSPVVAGVNTGPLIGAFTYNSVAATSYDSNSWATGSLTTTTMSANFTNQTVSVALAGTMGATSWISTDANIPITFINATAGTGASFNSYAPAIKVNAVTCPTCGGNINGSFVGQNYAGAIVQYNVWNNNNLNVDGSVAFDRMPVGANPAVSNGTPVSYGTYVMANNSFNVERPTAITTNGAGVLTGWGVGSSNSTVAPAVGSVAQTAVGTGSGTINWGQWGEGSVAASTFSYIPGVAQLHWITAPEPTPVYLAEVLTTTNAAYNFVGGDVTSLSGGVHGTITSGSTSLTANFTMQIVAVNLAATVNGHSWLASTTNAPLTYLNGNTLNGFYADSYRLPSQPGYLTVTVDAAPANGNLAGQLVGAALDGAILKFNLDGQVTTPTLGYEWVQGVAALGAAVANDPATAYRIVLASISDPTALAPTVMLSGGSNNAARVLTPGGLLTQFDDNPGGGSGQTIQYASAGAGAGFVDQGSAVIGGATVSWGRWDAGTVVNVQDRATGVWQNGIVLTGGAHAVVGPIMTGPVSLPTTGTYAYNFVGGTTPTTDTGALGAPLTGANATLQADFAAQTVNVGVNVTAGGATLGAAATNVPIQNRANFFTDTKMTGPGALVVTCTGACGTTNGGGIGGGFGGPGGVAAAITYGFAKVGANAGTVSGVAVFQR